MPTSLYDQLKVDVAKVDAAPDQEKDQKMLTAVERFFDQFDDDEGDQVLGKFNPDPEMNPDDYYN